MKTFKKVSAQGEVYVQRIDALPNIDLDKVGSESGFITVAHSESGNSHGFSDNGDVEVLERKNTPTGVGILYAIVKNPTELRQNAATPHETIRMEPGIYSMRIAREYDPFSEQARRVAD